MSECGVRSIQAVLRDPGMAVMIVPSSGAGRGSPSSPAPPLDRLLPIWPGLSLLSLAEESVASGLIRISSDQLGGLMVAADPAAIDDPFLAGLISDTGVTSFTSPEGIRSKDLGHICFVRTRDIAQTPLLFIWGETAAGLAAAVTALTSDLLRVPLPPDPADCMAGAIRAVVCPRPGVPLDLSTIPALGVALVELGCGKSLFNQTEGAWVSSMPNCIELVSDSRGARMDARLNGVSVGRIDRARARLLWLLALKSTKGQWMTIAEACPLVDGTASALTTRLGDLKRRAIGADFVECRYDPIKKRKEFRVKAKVVFKKV